MAHPCGFKTWLILAVHKWSLLLSQVTRIAHEGRSVISGQASIIAGIHKALLTSLVCKEIPTITSFFLPISSQVINPQVEAFVEIVVECVVNEGEKGDEVNVVTQGDGDEQSLGQHVDNDMFAKLGDMMDHDYSLIAEIDAQYNVIQPDEDEITQGGVKVKVKKMRQLRNVIMGEEGEDSVDGDFYVQDSNLHFDVDADMSEFMSAVDVDEHGILSGEKCRTF
ncbi:hypothetical protein LXL04_008389 [Taraxacum kok-saghyz]